MGQIVHAVVDADVQDKQQHHQHGIQHFVAVYQIVEDVIGGAVTGHQEHIIVIQQYIGGIGSYAEAEQNGEGDMNIVLLHAGHAGDQDVQRGKTGNGMGQTGNHIVKRQHGVAAVVLTGTVSTQHRAQNAENAHKIQRSLFQATAGEGGHRNGDQLDTAQEQGQIVQPTHRVCAPEAQQHDLKQLQAVDENGGNDQHSVFLLQRAVPVFAA